MTTDIEKSFKAKLRNIAREKDRNPADLWQAVVLERFLVRLGQSSHRNRFILKGGVLLAKYVTIGRETQDLDSHDLHSMITSVELSKLSLKQIILTVFHHRETPLNLPITFIERDVRLLQTQWASYRNRMTDQQSQNIPDKVEDFLKILNDRIKTVME